MPRWVELFDVFFFFYCLPQPLLFSCRPLYSTTMLSLSLCFTGFRDKEEMVSFPGNVNDSLWLSDWSHFCVRGVDVQLCLWNRMVISRKELFIFSHYYSRLCFSINFLQFYKYGAFCSFYSVSFHIHIIQVIGDTFQTSNWKKGIL